VEFNISNDDLTNLEILKCVESDYNEGRRENNGSRDNIISLSLRVSTILSFLVQSSISKQSSLRDHATHLTIN